MEPSKLAEALAKAQSEITEAEKDAVNPHFGKKYSTLTAVWAACREALTKNGLSVIQGTKTLENGKLVLETTLLHASGERVSFELPLVIEKQNMQGLGSALTYARRYGLSAIVGVSSDEDDDGNSASKGSVNQDKASQPDKKFTKAPEKTVLKGDLATFVMPFGKFKNQQLADINYQELSSYADFMAASMASDRAAGKKINSQGAETFEIVDQWLSRGVQDKSKHQAPKEHDDIPF